MAEQWYSIVEYARAYSISDMTVRRRIKNGKLHAVLKDGKYFIPVSGAPETNTPPPVKREPVYSAPAEQPRSTESYNTKPQPYSHARSRQVETPNLAPPHLSREENQVPTRQRNYENLPQAVTNPISQAEKLVMKADHLLEFCDKALSELHNSKRNHRDLYEAKIKTLEAKLSAKDIEIKQFRQQVEDLQVLVKILEEKSASM